MDVILRCLCFNFKVCINLANEQMQHFTNEHIFHREQQDCMEEGVPLIDLHYKSNQAILDTFFEVNQSKKLSCTYL